MGDKTRQIVAQYLHEHGYEKTLESFLMETNSEYSSSLLSEGSMLESIVQEHELLRRLATTTRDTKNQDNSELWGTATTDKPISLLYKSFDKIHQKNILAICYHPTQPWIATAGADCQIKITNYITGEVIYTLKGTDQASARGGAGIIALAFNPIKPNLLLSGSMDSMHRIYDLNLAPNPDSNPIIQSFNIHRKFVARVSWSPNGEYFATASYDHTSCIYKFSKDDNQYSLVKQIFFPTNVEAAVFTNDNSTLILAIRDDNYLHYVNINTFDDKKINMNEQKFDDHVSFVVLDLVVSPSGKYVLAATDKDRVIMFALGTNEQVKNFYGIANDQFSQPRAAWDLSGKFVYCTSEDNSIVVWDVVSKKVVTKMRGHQKLVRDIAIHPTKNILASCSYDFTIKIWQQEENTIAGEEKK